MSNRSSSDGRSDGGDGPTKQRRVNSPTKVALLGLFLVVSNRMASTRLIPHSESKTTFELVAMIVEPEDDIGSGEPAANKVILENAFHQPGNGSLSLHPSYLKVRQQCKRDTLYLPPRKLVQGAIQQLASRHGPASANNNNNIQSGTVKAAICVMQKNEDWYLEEWINYHFAIGFDDIYLFNDGEPKINLTSTEHLHIFPVAHLPARVHRQVAVYNACAEIIRGRQPSYNTTWVSFLDVDEFLVLKKHNSVTEFLNEHCPPHSHCGSLGINWLWFGTSNQTYYSPKPVTQRFVLRESMPVKTIKSIFRLDAFYCATNQHFVHLQSDPTKNPNKPPFPYDTQGRIHFRGPATPTANVSVAAFHHYTKSLEEWYVRRCIRGDVHRNPNLKCTATFPAPGEVRDTSAGDFYQSTVLLLDRNLDDKTRFVSAVGTPPWTHYPESEFGIHELVTPSRVFDHLNKQ